HGSAIHRHARRRGRVSPRALQQRAVTGPLRENGPGRAGAVALAQRWQGALPVFLALLLLLVLALLLLLALALLLLVLVLVLLLVVALLGHVVLLAPGRGGGRCERFAPGRVCGR